MFPEEFIDTEKKVWPLKWWGVVEPPKELVEWQLREMEFGAHRSGPEREKNDGPASVLGRDSAPGHASASSQQPQNLAMSNRPAHRGMYGPTRPAVPHYQQRPFVPLHHRPSSEWDRPSSAGMGRGSGPPLGQRGPPGPYRGGWNQYDMRGRGRGRGGRW